MSDYEYSNIIYKKDIPKLYNIVFGISKDITIPGNQPIIAGCLNSLDFALSYLDCEDEEIQKVISCKLIREDIVNEKQFKNFPPLFYSHNPISKKIKDILGENSKFIELSNFIQNKPSNYKIKNLESFLIDICDRKFYPSILETDSFELDLDDYTPHLIEYGLNQAKFKTKDSEVDINRIYKDIHYAIQVYNTYTEYHLHCTKKFIQEGYYIISNIIKYKIKQLTPKAPILTHIFDYLIKNLPKEYFIPIIISSLYSNSLIYFRYKEIPYNQDILNTAIKLKLEDVIEDQITNISILDVYK